MNPQGLCGSTHHVVGVLDEWRLPSSLECRVLDHGCLPLPTPKLLTGWVGDQWWFPLPILFLIPASGKNTPTGHVTSSKTGSLH